MSRFADEYFTEENIGLNNWSVDRGGNRYCKRQVFSKSTDIYLMCEVIDNITVSVSPFGKDCVIFLPRHKRLYYEIHFLFLIVFTKMTFGHGFQIFDVNSGANIPARILIKKMIYWTYPF